ncbi:hypothetical protein HK405_014582 [Cladochytrium tenue]|nr:hypothetical protein HK405_014582 [Cladochytrium tenue]
MPQLPLLPEPAIAAVFAHLDCRDAARAATVARAWAVSARTVLYAKLFIDGDDRPLKRDDVSGVRAGHKAIDRLCCGLASGLPFPSTSSSSPPSSSSSSSSTENIIEPCPIFASVRSLEINFRKIPHEDLGFLDGLTRAGARPMHLALLNLILTHALVTALRPIAARVRTLDLFADKNSGSDKEKEVKVEELLQMFVGRLTELSLENVSATAARCLLMGNRSSLRKLEIVGEWRGGLDTFAEFLATSPLLCDVTICLYDPNEAETMLEAVRAHCSATLSQLHLGLQDFEADRLLSILSGFYSIKSLTIELNHELAEEHPIPTPSTWPSIEVLKLRRPSPHLLPLLAGSSATIQSLYLGGVLRPVRKHARLPIHQAISLALTAARTVCFPVLRNIATSEWYTDFDPLTAAQLDGLVSGCPNLETLSLCGEVESLKPLLALPRLRRLNLEGPLGRYPGPVDDAVDLVLLRDDEKTAGGKPPALRVFLCDKREGLDYAPLTRHRAEEASERTSGRVRIVESQHLLPRYF